MRTIAGWVLIVLGVTLLGGFIYAGTILSEIRQDMGTDMFLQTPWLANYYRAVKVAGVIGVIMVGAGVYTAFMPSLECKS